MKSDNPSGQKDCRESRDHRSKAPETRGFPWLLYGAEFAGTGLLVFIGLSIVIVNFGINSPMAMIMPDAGLRRLITGFLFGSTGALIAVSPLGKESGAHINPVVTLAFCLMGRLRIRHTIGYVTAQMTGAVAGALPLLAWGDLGKSVEYGATLPGEGYSQCSVLAGEAIATFALIAGLFFFLGNKKLRGFTPLLFPFLYAIMVFIEAPISGTSTNPARTLGPAVIACAWKGWWIYWAGPILGTLSGVIVFRWSWLKRLELDVAKLFHFDHDRYSVFIRK